LVFNSYAKLNLYLEVLSKRKDGYHNIKTIFERIGLCDQIVLKVRKDKKINLTSDSPGLPRDNSKNLAYRSAELLQTRLNLDKGVDIQIIKRIPVAAGLGGGSSNAATVLMGLNKLWRLNLSRERLVGFAREIGSDVPFFIYNCPFAQGSGRGSNIKPLKFLKNLRIWHILVVPQKRVLTAKIYKQWDEKKTRLTPLDRHGILDKNRYLTGLTRPGYDVKILNSALRKKDSALIGEALFNSLEAVTLAMYPQVKRIKEKLKELGLKSILMSGSGPAVFGIASSRKEAARLCRQLKGVFKEEGSLWRVFATRTC